MEDTGRFQGGICCLIVFFIEPNFVLTSCNELLSRFLIYNSVVNDLVIFGLNQGLSCWYPSRSYVGSSLVWGMFSPQEIQIQRLGFARDIKGFGEEIFLGDDVCGPQLLNQSWYINMHANNFNVNSFGFSCCRPLGPYRGSILVLGMFYPLVFEILG